MSEGEATDPDKTPMVEVLPPPDASPPTDPDAPAPEGVTAEAEAGDVDEKIPDRPHICAKGHIQNHPGRIFTADHAGNMIGMSEPICAKCHLDWLSQKFRTRPMKKKPAQ